jgi:ferritin-like metal-binding protein YciE
MPETPTRDAKLVQYLNEAYGKEKQLETALEAHIAMTTRPPYKKRLQEHLKETKGHARAVERRIKQLGGTAEEISVPGPDVVSGAASKVQEVAHRGVALAQGPLHAVRGTGEEEKLLKNAKTEFSDEAEEIANYTAIETLAESVGDKETARMARGIRRQEERMSSFLERLIPQLTKAVAQAEIPASERNGAGGRRRTSGRSTQSRKASTRRKTSPRRKTSSRRKAAPRRKTGTSRRTTVRATVSASTRRGGKRRATVSASSRRSSGRRSSAKRRTRARA